MAPKSDWSCVGKTQALRLYQGLLTLPFSPFPPAQSSSAWYRRHFAPGAPAPLLPSPYAAASAAGPAGAGNSSEGSSSQAGLALYRSGFVAGGPLGRVFGANFNVSTLTTEVEDGADRFWRLGPVVSAMYRWAHGVLACECRHVTRSSP